jgi:hypothetical protein
LTLSALNGWFLIAGRLTAGQWFDSAVVSADGWLKLFLLINQGRFAFAIFINHDGKSIDDCE